MPEATGAIDRQLVIPAAVTVGGPGADELAGTGGADVLRGSRGPDVLRGAAGADDLFGGAGADTLEGGPGADHLAGGSGRDILHGDAGRDRLVGGAASDALVGGGGTDRLNGGGAADDIDGGAGSDVLRGGPGGDLFRVAQIGGAPDVILDFGDVDRLDLGDLLGGFGPDDLIDDFVQLRSELDGTMVAVDPAGDRGFQDAVLLAGVDARPALVSPDPLPEPILPGGLAVELADVVQVPAPGPASPFAPLQYLYHAGDGSGRLFVDDLRGQIWVVEDGALRPDPFLDLAAVLGDDLHPDLGSGGVRSFAFHPDSAIEGAAGFGRFYTVTVQVPGSSAESPDTPIFRWTESPVATVDVLSEWAVDPTDPSRIDPLSEREILRIEQPRIGHSTEHIGFNPSALPDDPDYGMLYIAIGDGGFSPTDPDPWRNGQDLSTLLGSILRIDPLPTGESSYGVPSDNPFVGQDGALPEIWAHGLRNPQRFSWDTGGDHKMLIGDIGQAYIEEVNLGMAGANYGWSQREGTFALGRPGEAQLFELPPFDASFHFTYPVAQYDHDGAISAVAGGYVYRGSSIPDLAGKYIFGDLVDGRVFYVDVEDLRPGEQADIQELTLLREGVPVTLLELVGEDRVDLRFGQGEDGELYLLTKQDGMIRTLEAVPEPATVAADAPAPGEIGSLLMAAPAPGTSIDQMLVTAPEPGV